ncbi:unnamed protein product, partial [Choristocarpus tenellus]
MDCQTGRIRAKGVLSAAFLMWKKNKTAMEGGTRAFAVLDAILHLRLNDTRDRYSCPKCSITHMGECAYAEIVVDERHKNRLCINCPMAQEGSE